MEGERVIVEILAVGVIRGSTLVQTLRRLEILVYIRSLYQANMAGPRCSLWGTNAPQHQGDCRAENVTMVHISAERRNSISPPQFNLIG